MYHIGAPRILTNFQEIVLVLMKLRLGLCELDIAYRFQILQSTVSRICSYHDRKIELLDMLAKWDQVRKTSTCISQKFSSMHINYRLHCDSQLEAI